LFLRKNIKALFLSKPVRHETEVYAWCPLPIKMNETTRKLTFRGADELTNQSGERCPPHKHNG
jgi:hypothetical protein